MRSAAPSRQLPVVEYLHHGIYLGRAGGAQASCEDEPVVAELRRNGLVDTISLAEFADGRPVYMDAAAPDAAACARAAESARRALALGNVPYSLATSNCEHLSSLCAQGAFRSRQVDACVKRLEVFLTRWHTDGQLTGALNLTEGSGRGRCAAGGAEEDRGEGADTSERRGEGCGARISGNVDLPGGGWLGSRLGKDDRYRVETSDDGGSQTCTQFSPPCVRTAAQWRDQVEGAGLRVWTLRFALYGAVCFVWCAWPHVCVMRELCERERERERERARARATGRKGEREKGMR